MSTLTLLLSQQTAGASARSSGGSCLSACPCFWWHGGFFFNVRSLLCLSTQTQTGWAAHREIRVGPLERRKAAPERRTTALIHTPSPGEGCTCVFCWRLCELACLSVCALSCNIPLVFRGRLYPELKVERARKQSHLVLFLYYLTQGHADIMNTSFHYLERTEDFGCFLPSALSESLKFNNTYSLFFSAVYLCTSEFLLRNNCDLYRQNAPVHESEGVNKVITRTTQV